MASENVVTNKEFIILPSHPRFDKTAEKLGVKEAEKETLDASPADMKLGDQIVGMPDKRIVEAKYAGMSDGGSTSHWRIEMDDGSVLPMTTGVNAIGTKKVVRRNETGRRFDGERRHFKSSAVEDSEIPEVLRTATAIRKFIGEEAADSSGQNDSPIAEGELRAAGGNDRAAERELSHVVEIDGSEYGLDTRYSQDLVGDGINVLPPRKPSGPFRLATDDGELVGAIMGVRLT